MSKPSFVYVTYIASTPEKVFHALTDPELTRQYWFNRRNASDWQVGSRWEHQLYDDPGHVDIVGRVVERDAPRRLVVTWTSPGDEANPREHSRVTFDVASYQGGVRLTVTHDELEPGSEMEKGISFGWPLVLSNLKTLLETGATLPMDPHRSSAKRQAAAVS